MSQSPAATPFSSPPPPPPPPAAIGFHAAPSGRCVDAGATPDQRTYATFMHVSVFAAHFGVIVVIPLVMWLMKRRESHFLDDHGKEALNFQISLLIYTLVGGVLTVVLIGFPLLAAAWILGIYGGIKASLAANRGEYYRYPMTLRLVA